MHRNRKTKKRREKIKNSIRSNNFFSLRVYQCFFSFFPQLFSFLNYDIFTSNLKHTNLKRMPRGKLLEPSWMYGEEMKRSLYPILTWCTQGINAQTEHLKWSGLNFSRNFPSGLMRKGARTGCFSNVAIVTFVFKSSPTWPDGGTRQNGGYVCGPWRRKYEQC